MFSSYLEKRVPQVLFQMFEDNEIRLHEHIIPN